MTEKKEPEVTEEQEVEESGGISRRKLLKLAAYSVPTAAIMSTPAASRLLAATQHPADCFELRPCVDPALSYQIVDCSTGQHYLPSAPPPAGACVQFVQAATCD